MDDITFDDNKNNKDRKKVKRLNINKKYYYFAILGLFLVVGISYAFIFFRERFEGNNLGLITELLDVKISENGLVAMDNAIPQKDEEGIENDRTTFNIVNNNRVPIRVVIKLVEDTNSNMDINQVRFGILASGKIMNVGNLGESDGVLLDFQMDPGQDATLESTIWLDYYYEGGTNTEVFSGKYIVEASNIDDYGYMYLKNLVGKNKGLVAINTDGELASEGDEIREYRYSGSAKYCTYTIDGNEYQLEVDGDTCPSACYIGTNIFKTTMETATCPSPTISPNQTMPLDGEVDNYVQFNNEMWRIIGVFNETTGSGTSQELIKIVRDEPLKYEEVPATYTYNGKTMTMKNTSGNYSNYEYAYMYWNYENYFSQTNYNDWTKSATQYYLNDETIGVNSYYNSIGLAYQKMIETVEYNISNTVPDVNTRISYNNERSGNVWEGNKATWTGKIGMMYLSDYGYASSAENWNVEMSNYGNLANPEKFNNWMNDNYRGWEWTISPTSGGIYHAMYVETFGQVTYNNVHEFSFAVSPVLYLKSDVLITAGNGSEEKPYQVERPELVRIPTKATTTIKSKLGTDGLVAINTDGELASENDKIREYRYSGSARYCTYTVDGNTYQLEVDSDTCPSAWHLSNNGTNYIVRSDNDVFNVDTGIWSSMVRTEIVSNENKPLDGEVDNYVLFNNEMWRIIGVFNEISDGTVKELVKIVRDEPLLQEEVSEIYTYNGKPMELKNRNAPYATLKHAYMYWNRENYFGQTNQNDWTNASLQYYLNDETSGVGSYYNSIQSDYRIMIEPVEYHISNTAYNPTAITSYNNERSGNVWEGNKATWNGKIGLIYPSDYGYAADSSNWSIGMNSFGLISNTGAFNNWMNNNVDLSAWTMSPSSNGNYFALAIFSYGFLDNSHVYYTPTVSPVLYLKSGVLITDGDGSYNNPYKLG